MRVRTINGVRWAKILGHPNEEYARLVHNRFAMYSGRDSDITERQVRAYNGITGIVYSVWITLENGERSGLDAEAALGILEKDKRTSGPQWDRYYSEHRQRNERFY